MTVKKISKPKLFIELAAPDGNGVSRWVYRSEFTGRYSELALGNGCDWARPTSSLVKNYILERHRENTRGRPISRMRLNGFQNEKKASQYVRDEFKRLIAKQCCVVLGTTKPEVDHKNGWKNDPGAYDCSLQKLSDFQPLSKAANDAKRQFCKECRDTMKRYDATRLGYPISYYAGGPAHDGSATGCVGCYWYDPLEFRQHLAGKDSAEK